MSKQLIAELSQLKLERDYLLRQIDLYYHDKSKRHHYFELLKSIDKNIEILKFKLKMEKELKNANNNTNNT